MSGSSVRLVGYKVMGRVYPEAYRRYARYQDVDENPVRDSYESLVSTTGRVALVREPVAWPCAGGAAGALRERGCGVLR